MQEYGLATGLVMLISNIIEEPHDLFFADMPVLA